MMEGLMRRIAPESQLTFADGELVATIQLVGTGAIPGTQISLKRQLILTGLFKANAEWDGDEILTVVETYNPDLQPEVRQVKIILNWPTKGVPLSDRHKAQAPDA
jgi:hypothetical protein